EQIRKAYEGNKTKPMPPLVLPVEPRQTAARETIEEAPIELGYFHFGWHIPDLRHQDVPTLDVLAVLLGNGRSSRLYQEIREKQGVVHHVDAWTYNPGAPGLFGMSAVVDGDKFEAARAAMLAEIEKVKQTPPTTNELNKAVKQFIAATLATRKTMSGQAQDLGSSWLAANDLNFSERYLAAVKRIKPEDVQRVARQYLTTENRTLYALLPNGSTPKVEAVVAKAVENAIQKFTLPNGLRLLVKSDHRLPFVEFRAVMEGGVLAESPQNNGISQLLTKMLLKGTKTRSAEDIAREIESVGGSIDTYGGNNSFGVNAEVLSSDFSTGLNLMADVILNPTFPATALEREREVQLAGIRSQKDEMLKSASKAMRAGLFGDIGYGLDSLGTEESVSRLSVDDLKAFHARLVAPNNCVLAIYGDVNAADVKAAVEKAFASWKPNPEAKLSASDKPPVVNSPKHITETRDKKQAVLVMGFAGTTIKDSDRYPLELLQESCSDLGSRLFMRIRDKLGLAYYVGAQNFMGLVPGYFAFYAGTTPENAAKVETEFLKEIELLRAEGITQEELDRSKAKIIGQKKIARQDLGGFAMVTALDELYGLGYQYSDSEDAKYQSVTLEQVKAVAQKYLQPDAFVLAVVKPE
ncbi:MAG TPA: insulinase family protein, partial [Verrucomicrobiota bacterium]|nr:insulinase family protein [Verrucomicrobiota bacterium]